MPPFVRFGQPWIAAIGLLLASVASGDPAAETKSPPRPAIKVPEGFTAELLFQLPEIEHPSVVTCDDDGNLFVGEDPMDMRGPTTKEFDRILLFRWDPNGGPPKKTVFCENLSAVFGMVWLDGSLYVMHAPHYTMFRDTDGDGVADVRKDLADGFGPPAGIFGFNDHIVTGTRLGMDGRIYVSVGDKGIQKATGADGSTITLEGGGVVRMRPDGTELEVVTSGTRNHLDVAMDSLDNIFTYDNTDDGLGWWTRFTHHVPTGYYGYPYDYHPHPDRHLPRISEHGGGSPCGAACYREAAWPEKYRNSPFFCEWGKGKVQNFYLERSGATFTAKIEDFAIKEGEGDFRPVDLCFSPDGKHMYLADWNFGGWTNPKQAGRLFRITYVGTEVPPEPPRTAQSANVNEVAAALGHPSHRERMLAQQRMATFGEAAIGPLSQSAVHAESPWARIHAVWALNGLMDTLPNFDPTTIWLACLRDQNENVRAQAARALGLRRQKMGTLALHETLKDQDPTVRLQSALALGRIADPRSAVPLTDALKESDPTTRFIVMQAIRALNDWRPTLTALHTTDSVYAKNLLLALTGQYDEHAVAALRQWSWEAPTPVDRATALSIIAEVHRKSADYTEGWWGTQPAKGKPKRPKDIDWSGTGTVLVTLMDGLVDAAPEVRLAAVRGLRSAYPNDAATAIRGLVVTEPNLEVRKEAIAWLMDHPDPAALEVLVRLSQDTSAAEEIREVAIDALGTLGDQSVLPNLVAIAETTSSPARIVAKIVNVLGKWKATAAASNVQALLNHESPIVRTVAVENLAKISGSECGSCLVERLRDPVADVRKTAAKTLGELKARDAVPALVEAASDPDVRFAAIAALTAMPDRKALGPYLDELVGKSPDLRMRCRNALIALRQEIGPDIVKLHERSELSSVVRVELQTVFSAPAPILQWKMIGAWEKPARPEFDPKGPPDLNAKLLAGDRELSWKDVTTSSPSGEVNVLEHIEPTGGVWALAYAEVISDSEGKVNATVGSDDQLILWVNGEQVYEFQGDRGYGPEDGRIKIRLRKGANHIYALAGNTSGPWAFGVQIGRKAPEYAFLYEDLPEKLEPTAYAEFATKNAGNPERGQKLFADREGVACIKCHAVRGTGGNAGPDLNGIGSRYPREELIRSVLEPSNRVLASYQVTVFATVDGDILQGIIKSETAEKIELVTNDGTVKELAVADIESRQKSAVSLMPNGLKDGMSVQDFADIIAYLDSLKEPATTAAAQE